MSKNNRRLDQSTFEKEAGATLYLVEELSDARLRCDQLKRYVAEAVKLVNASEKRDHFFEVAGNLLYGIPDALFKLDKALDATALAVSRLDYEELKQQLKPEKADELEQVLNDVRIRHVDRRSDPMPLKGKTAMRTFKASSQDRIASALRRVAESVEAGEVSPDDARKRLHRVLMALSQTAEQAMQAMGPLQANSREEVMKGFKSANPDLTDEQLNEIADQWEKNKDVVKDKAGGVALSEDEKQSRFEEGKPADPTLEMSDSDAKEWRRQNEKNKDNFKTAAEFWKAKCL